MSFMQLQATQDMGGALGAAPVPKTPPPAIGGATPYDGMFSATEQKYGIPPGLLKALAHHESGFNPKAVGKNTNGTEDRGIMQLNNKFDAERGVTDPFDPAHSIDIAGKLVADLGKRYNGDIAKVVEAYNGSGPAARAYAQKVLPLVKQYIAAGTGGTPAAGGDGAPSVGYNPATGKMFVNGLTFGVDDGKGWNESLKIVDKAGTGLPDGFNPVDRDTYITKLREARTPNATLGGALKSLGTSVASGIGAVGQFAAEAPLAAVNAYRSPDNQFPNPNFGKALADWSGLSKQDLGNQASIGTTTALQQGDITNPDDIRKGFSQATVGGLVHMTMQGFGALIPGLGAGMISPVLGAVVFGAMAGGSNGEQAYNDLMAKKPAEWAKIPEYNQLVQSGYSPQAAANAIATKTRQAVTAATAPVGALDMLLPTVGGLGAKASAKILASMAKAAMKDMAYEGTQEVVEGVVQKAVQNKVSGFSDPVMEGSLGNFVGGALAGGPIGAGQGGLSALGEGNRQREAAQLERDQAAMREQNLLAAKKTAEGHAANRAATTEGALAAKEAERQGAAATAQAGANPNQGALFGVAPTATGPVGVAAPAPEPFDVNAPLPGQATGPTIDPATGKVTKRPGLLDGDPAEPPGLRTDPKMLQLHDAWAAVAAQHDKAAAAGDTAGAAAAQAQMEAIKQQATARAVEMYHASVNPGQQDMFGGLPAPIAPPQAPVAATPGQAPSPASPPAAGASKKGKKAAAPAAPQPTVDSEHARLKAIMADTATFLGDEGVLDSVPEGLRRDVLRKFTAEGEVLDTRIASKILDGVSGVAKKTKKGKVTLTDPDIEALASAIRQQDNGARGPLKALHKLIAMWDDAAMPAAGANSAEKIGEKIGNRQALSSILQGEFKALADEIGQDNLNRVIAEIKKQDSAEAEKVLAQGHTPKNIQITGAQKKANIKFSIAWNAYTTNTLLSDAITDNAVRFTEEQEAQLKGTDVASKLEEIIEKKADISENGTPDTDKEGKPTVRGGWNKKHPGEPKPGHNYFRITGLLDYLFLNDKSVLTRVMARAIRASIEAMRPEFEIVISKDPHPTKPESGAGYWDGKANGGKGRLTLHPIGHNPKFILHELIHAVTADYIMRKHAEGNDPHVIRFQNTLNTFLDLATPEAVAKFLKGRSLYDQKRLEDLLEKFDGWLNKVDKNGQHQQDVALAEFIAYGMTEKVMQDFMKSLKIPATTDKMGQVLVPNGRSVLAVWSKFVEAVSQLILGRSWPDADGSVMAQFLSDGAQIMHAAASEAYVKRMAGRPDPQVKLTAAADWNNTFPDGPAFKDLSPADRKLVEREFNTSLKSGNDPAPIYDVIREEHLKAKAAKAPGAKGAAAKNVAKVKAAPVEKPAKPVATPEPAAKPAEMWDDIFRSNDKEPKFADLSAELKSVWTGLLIPDEVTGKTGATAREFDDIVKRHRNNKANKGASGKIKKVSEAEETPTQTQEEREYEGRLFGGAYSAKLGGPFAPRGSAKYKMIQAGRERFNELRAARGLPPVTNWDAKTLEAEEVSPEIAAKYPDYAAARKAREDKTAEAAKQRAEAAAQAATSARERTEAKRVQHIAEDSFFKGTKPRFKGPLGWLDSIYEALFKATGLPTLTKDAWAGLEKANAWIADTVPQYRTFLHNVVSGYGLPQPYLAARHTLQQGQVHKIKAATSFFNVFQNMPPDQQLVVTDALLNPDKEAALRANLTQDQKDAIDYAKTILKALIKDGVDAGTLPADLGDMEVGSVLKAVFIKDVGEPGKTGLKRSSGIMGTRLKDIGKVVAAPAGNVTNSPTGRYHRVVEYRKDGTQSNYFIPVEGGTAKLNAMRAAGMDVEVDTDNVWRQSKEKTNGETATFYRPFTSGEMVEGKMVSDPRYLLHSTVHHMMQDIMHAEMFNFLASYGRDNSNDTGGVDGPGTLVFDSEEAALEHQKEYADQGVRPQNWVQVPNTNNTAGKAKYGALAGKWVPQSIWNDINSQVSNAPMFPGFDKWLTRWKLAKTAFSPVTHFNNVMSNFALAFYRDVPAGNIIEAAKIYWNAENGTPEEKAAAQKIIEEFDNSGANIGSYGQSEIRRGQMLSVLEDLAKTGATETKGMSEHAALMKVMEMIEYAKATTFGKGAVAGYKVASAVATGSVNLGKRWYEMEDNIFRLASYMTHIQNGESNGQAGLRASQDFVDYNITAPWINKLRGSFFPFIAWPYRMIPAMIGIAVEKPWKFASMVTALYGLNALGYALAGGDEEEERRYMPEYQKGRLGGVLPTPKMLRLPATNTFMDISAAMPLGDLGSMDPAGFFGAPWMRQFMPGGPLIILAESLFGYDSFRGEKMTKETNTVAQNVAAVAKHLAQQSLPNLPYPGSRQFDTLIDVLRDKHGLTGAETNGTLKVLSILGPKIYANDIKEEKAIQGIVINKMYREYSAAAREIANREYRFGDPNKEKVQADIKALNDRFLAKIAEMQKP